jgi:hypothetical protein
MMVTAISKITTLVMTTTTMAAAINF